jgi:hypothetical protein
LLQLEAAVVETIGHLSALVIFIIVVVAVVDLDIKIT